MPPSAFARVTARSTWALPDERDTRQPRTTIIPMDEVRLDKWLWAARFYKTRSLAVDEIAKGRVSVNGQPAKPARALRVSDQVEVRREGVARTVVVRALSEVRGPAPVAQALYEETADSVARRELYRRTTHEVLGRITISAGVAQSRASDTVDSLIGRADAGLYLAKRRGRNCVIGDAGPTARQLE